MSSALPIVFGCRGLDLTRQERQFFHAYPPLGFILFSRNIDSPLQLSRLLSSLASCLGRWPLLLVDQEGGPVQRLAAPHWSVFPPARHFGALWQQQGRRKALAACKDNARRMARELKRVGFTVACSPVADLPIPLGDPIIGERAFSDKRIRVARLARAHAEGLLEEGILPVVKHAPGHGRALCDSHKSLPSVRSERAQLRKTDFACFRALCAMPLMMTAHVRYEAFDEREPTTLSAATIEGAIREDIGFKGILLSDDLCMKALSGAQIGRRALAAGCDVLLHCSANMTEMRATAEDIAPASAAASASASRALDAKLEAAFARVLRSTGKLAA